MRGLCFPMAPTRRLLELMMLLAQLLATDGTTATAESHATAFSQTPNVRRLLQPEGQVVHRSFALPPFAYRMTVVDDDMDWSDFADHLERLTAAHLETFLVTGLSQSQSVELQDAGIQGIAFHTDLHRAFAGQDPESGEPRALVHCTFAGVASLLLLENAPSGDPSDPPVATGDVLARLVHEAFDDTTLLQQRLQEDDFLNAIVDITVHVSGVAGDGEETIDETTSRLPQHPMVLTGGTFVVTCCVMLGLTLFVRRLQRIRRRNKRRPSSTLSKSSGGDGSASTGSLEHDHDMDGSRDCLTVSVFHDGELGIELSMPGETASSAVLA
jgi:hypothetical protein